MSVLFRRSFKTVIFSRFLKVAIATSNFMNKVYNGGLAPEFSISMLKETIAPVWDYGDIYIQVSMRLDFMKVIKRIVSLGVAFVNVLCMKGYSKSCFTSLEGHRKWPIKRPGRLFRKKSFGWELFWTGCLRLGRLQKNKHKQ